jgi:acyl carrier protein
MSNHASTLRQPLAPADTEGLARELAQLIVQALNLELSATDIDPDAPLYGEGLGLDSIDILEIALVVSKRYGVQLRADSAENEQIFRSLRRLAEYLNAHRTN